MSFRSLINLILYLGIHNIIMLILMSTKLLLGLFCCLIQTLFIDVPSLDVKLNLFSFPTYHASLDIFKLFLNLAICIYSRLPLKDINLIRYRQVRFSLFKGFLLVLGLLLLKLLSNVTVQVVFAYLLLGTPGIKATTYLLEKR